MQPRIMYIERKDGLAGGSARIGRVTYSKTGRTIYYGEKSFAKTKAGYKFNCYEVGTGTRYWISGPKRDGSDRLYGEGVPVTIDEEVREEYWVNIRKRPVDKGRKTYLPTVPKKYQN